MKSVDVIIIVPTARHVEDHRRLEEAIKNTWGNSDIENIKIVFCTGSDVECSLSDRNMVVSCSEDVLSLGYKTILSFEQLVKTYKFKYIFRTNLGSYIDLKKILEFISNKPREKFYCGIIGTHALPTKPNLKFASGSGYFLSVDVVNLILQNKLLWNHNLIDDVALGDILSNLDIKISEEATRLSLCNEDILFQRGSEIIPDFTYNDIYHYRLRSNIRTQDIENMYRLHLEILNKA